MLTLWSNRVRAWRMLMGPLPTNGLFCHIPSFSCKAIITCVVVDNHLQP